MFAAFEIFRTVVFNKKIIFFFSIADEFNNLRPDTNLVIIPIREKSDGNGKECCISF